MGDRGRKPASELAVVSSIWVAERPEPPEELTAEQAVEWKAIVGRLPPEWFPRETHGMLVQYCRHIVAARQVAMQIEEKEGTAENFDIKDYDTLLKMQEREGRAASSLATRMRLTQQSTYDPKKKKGDGPAKPWEAKSGQ